VVELFVGVGVKIAGVDDMPAGKFVRLRFTDELNPPNAVTVTGILTFCPAMTVWLATWPNAKSGPKLAVTLLGAVMLTFCVGAVPVRSPPKPENGDPPFALALTVTTSPLLCHPLAGLIFPPAAGLTAVVRKYCVAKFAV
jgi:hypothetical protein